ncbi:hypothetical protein GWN26_13570 [Candidatus Saccharibacteria bacterium]|nr:hypothetical protein [Candidatus Saccharibacteria bacterium]NIV04346.1 hypothetical protein [Calditrichia bacterium]NIS38887.1 hypothetical protein [Candidatus Saccharibacteria bacterium]NIV72871.1 hypothetical protein [Calditrichia bacterium]NIW00086.1 hypothetical protein [Candidatus Saccharibacteria bacterium]
MGTWHIDDECESALINLNDRLCSFERATSREYTLILVPHNKDEKIHISQSGKPIPIDLGSQLSETTIGPEEILAIAMQSRKA